MIEIINNRRIDNRQARVLEFLRWHSTLGTVQELEAIIDRAFQAGVNAQSDATFASLFVTICSAQPHPVASMDLPPGGMIALIRKEGAA